MNKPPVDIPMEPASKIITMPGGTMPPIVPATAHSAAANEP
jgi:hypothetical protein